MSDTVTLSPGSVEQIAARVAELLRDEQPAGPDLIDAAEVARRLGISRATVYERADDLGAIRLGGGPKARLRFDPEVVVEALAPRPFNANNKPTTPRRQRRSNGVALLPVRGSRPR